MLQKSDSFIIDIDHLTEFVSESENEETELLSPPWSNREDHKQLRSYGSTPNMIYSSSLSRSLSLTEDLNLPEISGKSCKNVTAVFSVKGMSCAACVHTIESYVSSTFPISAENGILSFHVHLLAERGYMEFDETTFPRSKLEDVVHCIEELGFEAQLLHAENSDPEEHSKEDCSYRFLIEGEDEHLIIKEQLQRSNLQWREGVESWSFPDSDDIRLEVTLHIEQYKPRHFLNHLRAAFPHLTISFVDTSELGMSTVNKADTMTETMKWKARFLQCCIFGLAELALSMFLYHVSPFSDWLHSPLLGLFASSGDYILLPGLMIGPCIEFILVGILVFGQVGRYFGGKCLRCLKMRTATMDVLIGLGVSLSLCFSLFSFLLAIYHGGLYGSSLMNSHKGMSMGATSMSDWSGSLLMDGRMPWLFLETASTLLLFICFGRWLEARAKVSTASALHTLTAMKPMEARVVDIRSNGVAVENNGVSDPTPSTSSEQDEWIPPGLLVPGDVVKVLVSEAIPVDGYLWSERHLPDAIGSVNESMLTGESLPVLKTPQDLLLAGSLNVGRSPLYLRVLHAGRSTLLSKIAASVEHAQTSKPSLQHIADRVASVFVPFVLLCGLITLATWLFLTVGVGYVPPVSSSGSSMSSWNLFTTSTSSGSYFNPWIFSFKMFISVVMIACPCGLGLAAPTATMVGTGMAARDGVLLKNGDVLDVGSRVETLLLDKTGTLTTGFLSVQSWRFPAFSDTDIALTRLARKMYRELNSIRTGSQNELKEIAHWYLCALAERNSEHPIGQAILRHTHNYQDRYPHEWRWLDAHVRMQNCIVQPGKGIKLDVSWTGEDRSFAFLMGNAAWFTDNNVRLPQKIGDKRLLGRFYEAGLTVIFTSMEDMTWSFIGLQDTLHPDSQGIVTWCQQQGFRVGIVSGDQERTVQVIGKRLGISAEAVFGGCSPETKKSIVKDIQEGRRAIPLTRPTRKRSSVFVYMRKAWRTLMNCRPTGVLTAFGDVPFVPLMNREECATNNEEEEEVVEKPPQVFVAMIGDGMNDAPALAQADLGIAIAPAFKRFTKDTSTSSSCPAPLVPGSMSASGGTASIGSDLSLTSSSVLFLRPVMPLSSLAFLLTLSKLVTSRIRLNFVLASLYNMISVPLAMGFFVPFGVLVHPMWSGVAMAASSLSVVLSSLAIRWFFKPPSIAVAPVFLETSEDGSFMPKGRIDQVAEEIPPRLLNRTRSHSLLDTLAAQQYPYPLAPMKDGVSITTKDVPPAALFFESVRSVSSLWSSLTGPKRAETLPMNAYCEEDALSLPRPSPLKPAIPHDALNVTLKESSVLSVVSARASSMAISPALPMTILPISPPLQYSRPMKAVQPSGKASETFTLLTSPSSLLQHPLTPPHSPLSQAS